MGILDFNKIKRWAFFIFSAWALLAFIAWHYESTCGMFLSGACWAQHWKGARYLVLLRWVSEYQTLVAGLLALLGASTVFYAAKYTTDKKHEAEKRRQKEAAEIACSIVSAELRDEIIKLQNLLTPSPKSRHLAKAPFTQSYMYLPTLCVISPQLGPIVAARLREIIETLHNPNGINIVEQIAYAEVVFYMLLEIPDRLTSDGRYNMDSPTKLSSKNLRETLANLDWTLERIFGLGYFFDDGRAN